MVAKPLTRLLAALGTALTLGVLALSTPANAQDIDRAIGAYQAGQYEDSATLFFAILRFEEDPGLIAEAQYGLAKSFEELDIPLAALKYYEDIIAVGADHPYFDKAVEGLLDVSERQREDLKTPAILDAMYDPNFSALEKMNPEILQRIHYVLGRYAFNRQDVRFARQFLGTVKEGNPSYPSAQYMLGLIRLGVGRLDNPKPKFDKALQHFRNARDAIDIDTQDERQRELRDLATLGIARTYYERSYLLEDGDPKRALGLKGAIQLYRRIPRFAKSWPDALFERAWAHTVANEYGKALGALQNLEAPFFDTYFYPEADILRAIVYYYNCQWDRVNGVLDEAKAKYTPMVERLETILESDYELEEWYVLLNKSLEAGPDATDERLIPWPVANQITRDAKFQKMESFLQELEREGEIFQTSDTFSRSEMGTEMTDFALGTRDAFLQVIGKFVRGKLNQLKSELTSITTRASLVSLETKTAETEWLEQGREIGGQARSKLPVPFVPDETFQFWEFRGEYWVDELGYMEYAIKTECFE